MKIREIRERSVNICRYSGEAIAGNTLTTSIVAIVSDVEYGGQPIVGFGFSSVGRYAQSGLIRDRFAPRLLEAASLPSPLDAWRAMMAGEKPGGHGERCVAVGTLDMALWDLAAKIAGLPAYALIRQQFGRPALQGATVPVYAGGGYRYPRNDMERLRDEALRAHAMGFTKMKVKIGETDLVTDIRRIETVAQIFGADNVAVDAMNRYDLPAALDAANTLAPLNLWWFEDVVDPLDFQAWAAVAASYEPPLAAGEALFSSAEAHLLLRHGGLRRTKDALVFDPVHCYGIPGYHAILQTAENEGWPARSFWPHGGHLFSLHVAAAFGLGGSELNPFSFQPFGGVPDDMRPNRGAVTLPPRPGIGFEAHEPVYALFRSLTADDAICSTSRYGGKSGA